MKQIIKNVVKLLECYERTKDESLLEIVKGLLEALVDEMEDTGALKITGPFPYFPVGDETPVHRQPLAPSVAAYAIYMDDHNYDPGSTYEVKTGIEFFDGDNGTATETLTCSGDCCHRDKTPSDPEK